MNKSEAVLTKKGHIGTKWVKFPPKTWEILTHEPPEDGIVRQRVGGTRGTGATTPVPHTQKRGPPRGIWGRPSSVTKEIKTSNFPSGTQRTGTKIITDKTVSNFQAR